MSEICKFCGGPELRPDMVEVGPMPGGTLYLHRDQTHPGRLLMASARRSMPPLWTVSIGQPRR